MSGKKQHNKYYERFHLMEIPKQEIDSKGVVHSSTEFIYTDDEEEFVNIPASVFDTESLVKSGNLQEVQKLKFSTGVDIDMLDKAQDSFVNNFPDVEPTPESKTTNN